MVSFRAFPGPPLKPGGDCALSFSADPSRGRRKEETMNRNTVWGMVIVGLTVFLAMSSQAGLFDAIKKAATETITIKESPRRTEGSASSENIGSAKDGGAASSFENIESVEDGGAASSNNGQILSAQDTAAECEKSLITFIEQIGQKASGDNGAFVGVEVYKGIRLGMSEREFHKIVKGTCRDTYEFKYPSAKVNRIDKNKGSIGDIYVYLGGLDFEKNLYTQNLDENRQNFLVTRVKFCIRGAAENPGIAEIENQFAKRFGEGVKIDRSTRSERNGNGVIEYPVIKLSRKGQAVVLTQLSRTDDVEVTAIYEVAEEELRKLRSSYEESAKKAEAENAKKEALDF